MSPSLFSASSYTDQSFSLLSSTLINFLSLLFCLFSSLFLTKTLALFLFSFTFFSSLLFANCFIASLPPSSLKFLFPPSLFLSTSFSSYYDLPTLPSYLLSLISPLPLFPSPPSFPSPASSPPFFHRSLLQKGFSSLAIRVVFPLPFCNSICLCPGPCASRRNTKSAFTLNPRSLLRQRY